MPLLDVFEGRRQLLVYFHMWHDGQPAADQCEGCTFFTGQARELSYLHSRDVTYATFCEGPYDESARYRDFMGWDMPWYSARDSSDALLAGRRDSAATRCYLRDGDRVFETYWTTGRGTEAGASSYHLLDLTVYGRQETWEDSPEGWPQPIDPTARRQFRTNGRPTAQWSRLAAGPVRRPDRPAGVPPVEHSGRRTASATSTARPPARRPRTTPAPGAGGPGARCRPAAGRPGSARSRRPSAGPARAVEQRRPRGSTRPR